MMYQTETREAFSVVFKIFEKLWCLPNEHESQLKFLLKSSLLRFVSSLGWWGVFFHLIMSKNHTNVTLSQDFGIVISFASNQLAPIIFVMYRKEWLTLFQTVTDFSTFGKLQDFERKTRHINLYPVLYLVYSTVGIIIYAITSFLEGYKCQQINEERGLHEICGTLAPIWLPFNGDNWPTRISILFVQIITTYFVVYATIAIAVLPLSVTELIISHINHFKILFNEIFEEEDRNVQTAKFSSCVKYHNHIIRMANDLSYLTKITLGHYSLTGAVGLGFIGSQLLQEKSVAPLLHLSAFLMAQFILCHCGQRLMDETSSIHQSVYISKWYLSDPKMVKNVQFVMARSQKPLTLAALPFGSYNYPLFVMVIKTAYSYLTLINESI